MTTITILTTTKTMKSILNPRIYLEKKHGEVQPAAPPVAVAPTVWHLNPGVHGQC